MVARKRSGLRREQKPWLGLIGELAWGTSLSVYELFLLGDRSWWWRLHLGLWWAYRDWNPDKVLDALPPDRKLETLAYGETPSSTVRRALEMCRDHFPNSFSIVDYGAGRGMVALTAAALGWDALAIEYLEEFLRRSQPLSQKLGWSVEWVHGNFLELPIPDADIHHLAATAFPEHVRETMTEKFAEQGHPEQGLLLQDWIIDDERFEILCSLRLPVTWGSSVFTLHRLKPSISDPPGEELL